MNFHKTIKNYKQLIDANLSNFFNNKLREIEHDFLKKCYNLLKEYTLREGKRLRPICTIMAYNCFKKDEQKIIVPSLSIELMHNSTLIHDDVMDEDLYRRNKPSMHKLFEIYSHKILNSYEYKSEIFKDELRHFSISMAILQGNIMQCLSQSCVKESNFKENEKLQALGILNESYEEINQGQILDILLSTQQNFNEKAYLVMVKKKTSKLFISAVELGCIFSKCPRNKTNLMKKYAENMAIAFQIQDDKMDLKENNSFNIPSDVAKNYISKAKFYLKKAHLPVQGNEFFNDLADFVVDRMV